MAVFADVQDVRDIGNLPDATKLDDRIIIPHLVTAERELIKWIGTYTRATGDKQTAILEAEACLTMSYVLPVLNTFFTEGISTIQKEIGEIDFQFHDPSDVTELVTYWENRARDAVSEWLQEGDQKRIGFHAI